MDPPAHYVESMLPARAPPTRAAEPISVGLSAAILAVRGDEPMVAVVPASRREREGDGALPCGPFSPRQHKTLEAGLRFWVRQQTGIELGHTRQICTLGSRQGPAGEAQPQGLPVVVVCYLALVAPAQCNDQDGAVWRIWYAYFPWEDWRRGKPRCLTDIIEPHLEAWTRLSPPHCEARVPREALDRTQRLRIAFAGDAAAWDEEKVLERYELLLEAGLAGEPAENGDGGHVLAEWHPPWLAILARRSRRGLRAPSASSGAASSASP